MCHAPPANRVAAAAAAFRSGLLSPLALPAPLAPRAVVMPSSVTFACRRRRTLTSLPSSDQDGRTKREAFVRSPLSLLLRFWLLAPRPSALPDGYCFFRRGWRESDATSTRNHCRVALPQRRWRRRLLLCPDCFIGHAERIQGMRRRTRQRTQ